MAWNPFVRDTPSSGPERTFSLLVVLGVAMCLVASLLTNEVPALQALPLAFWGLLVVQIFGVLLLVTAVHASRSFSPGDERTPWTVSFVRALEPLGVVYVGAMLTAFGCYATFVKGDDPTFLGLAAIGLLLTIGCLIWLVRAVRQRP